MTSAIASERTSARYVAWAWFELLRHDLVATALGFHGVYGQLVGTLTRRWLVNAGVEVSIERAVDWAVALYPKPVQCLQRSFVLARMLRRCGIPADVAIGYRPIPFFSHAWVEVGDRVINDQPSYRKHLNILLRSCALSQGAEGATPRNSTGSHISN